MSYLHCRKRTLLVATNRYIVLIYPFLTTCKQYDHSYIVDASSSNRCSHYLLALYYLMLVYLFAGSWQSATTEKKLKIRWPKNFTSTRLGTISIGGFSGESELIQLLFFLLRRSPVLKDC
uniref:Uncharacterized protein n=1 Tax=Arundo donax TaxID=35708 RepID=A0A0A8YQF6_ARUDO